MSSSEHLDNKLRGTIGLLKQALAIIFCLILAGLILSATFSFAYGMIMIGSGIFAIGGIIISYRRIIWDAYVLSFAGSKKQGMVRKISQPSMLSYKLNIYFVWPLAMAIGVALILIGVFSSLD